MFKYGLAVALLACAVGSGCKKKSESASPPIGQAQSGTKQTGAQPGPAQFDACAFITREEIAEVEGSPVKDIKNSGHSDAGFSFAQCFYTTEQFNLSVSLAVTRSDPMAKPPRSVKEYWEEMFAEHDKEHGETKAEPGREGDKEKKESLREQRREREEEGKEAAPKKVDGIGEEAFWVGNRVGGALYVLHKGTLVRVSVGGPDPEEKKIEKSKALTQKALRRL